MEQNRATIRARNYLSLGLHIYASFSTFFVTFDLISPTGELMSDVKRVNLTDKAARTDVQKWRIDIYVRMFDKTSISSLQSDLVNYRSV